MGSLASLTTDEVIDRVLGSGSAGHADMRDEMNRGWEAAWSATSPRLLELCRVRIATMLGCDSEAVARTPDADVEDGMLKAIANWPGDPRFTAVDRACLALTEHFVIDVASLDDTTVAAVRDHLGDEGTQNFVTALLMVEQRIRLRLAWDRLLGGD
jgi:alkylhydroperoxidase family enzyme